MDRLASPDESLIHFNEILDSLSFPLLKFNTSLTAFSWKSLLLSVHEEIARPLEINVVRAFHS